jgi:hypothetical protein
LTSINKDILYILEAKQDSAKSGTSTPKRVSTAYNKYMQKALIQATACAPDLSVKPPFLLTCGIGSHFQMWTGFSGDYGGHGAGEKIEIDDLLKPDIFDLFVDMFTDIKKVNQQKLELK